MQVTVRFVGSGVLDRPKHSESQPLPLQPAGAQ